VVVEYSGELGTDPSEWAAMLPPPARLAVDDAGAGYASFLHVLALRPDYIKIDMGLVRGLHLDPARQALVRALVGFADEAGCQVVAEGVEAHEELTALHRLGVHYAQGFLLAEPSAAPGWSGFAVAAG
jgi:EAL domain-containing protein (putative c-di-GMP-specific phosphodiesterase class I)